MTPSPVVWLVDDLPANRKAFEQAHGQAFNIKTFSDPLEVLRRLNMNEHPDALLCDVFIYDPVEKAQEIEKRIDDEAVKLRRMAHDIGADADAHLAGIDLLEAVSRKFKGSPPFSVYAYTSKGPYLLQQAAWDRIVESGATVLLKNRFGPQSERMLIQRDIDLVREQNSLGARIQKNFVQVVIATGLLGAILGVVLDRLAKSIGW